MIMVLNSYISFVSWPIHQNLLPLVLHHFVLHSPQTLPNDKSFGIWDLNRSQRPFQMIFANLALRREESERFKCTSYLYQHELQQWSVSNQTTFINIILHYLCIIQYFSTKQLCFNHNINTSTMRTYIQTDLYRQFTGGTASPHNGVYSSSGYMRDII